MKRLAGIPMATGPRRGLPVWLPAALLGLALIPWLNGGCAHTAAPGAQAANATVSPDWDALGIKTLAFVCVGSSGADETVRQTAERIVDDELQRDQDRFVIVAKDDARARAGAADASDLFDKVEGVWKDSRVADQFLVQQLCAKLSVDGLIFGDLGDWKTQKADWEIENTSSTQVTLRLAIYSAKNGTLAWEAQKIQRKESMKYTPQQSGTAIYTDPSGASRVERPNSLTPDPPPPEEVATEAMQALIQAFPPKTPA